MHHICTYMYVCIYSAHHPMMLCICAALYRYMIYSSIIHTYVHSTYVRTDTQTDRPTYIHTIQYNTLQNITKHYSTLQYVTIHSNTFQYITIHYSTLQYVTIHSNTFQYITIHANTCQYMPIHSNTFQYITIYYNILPYITIHYHTLHALHTYVCTYLHTCMPTCLPTYLHAYLPTYIPTCLHTYLPTYMPTYLPTYLHTYMPTYIPTCLPTYLQTCRHTHTHTRTRLHAYKHILNTIPWYLPAFSRKSSLSPRHLEAASQNFTAQRQQGGSQVSFSETWWIDPFEAKHGEFLTKSWEIWEMGKKWSIKVSCKSGDVSCKSRERWWFNHQKLGLTN